MLSDFSWAGNRVSLSDGRVINSKASSQDGNQSYNRSADHVATGKPIPAANQHFLIHLWAPNQIFPKNATIDFDYGNINSNCQHTYLKSAVRLNQVSLSAGSKASPVPRLGR